MRTGFSQGARRQHPHPGQALAYSEGRRTIRPGIFAETGQLNLNPEGVDGERRRMEGKRFKPSLSASDPGRSRKHRHH
jgi:hypothetical protein